MSEPVEVVEAAPAVLAAIVAVNKAIAAEGIAKADENKQQGFKFRGVDAVYDAVAGPMAEHGIFSVPDVLSVERAERASRNGGVLFIVYLHVRYTFWCSTDGSSVSTTVVAEAMDSGDKATAKAMSVAHRTALLQLSTAPVNPAEAEADADTYEVAPAPPPPPLGWATREEARYAHAGMQERLADLTDEQRAALKLWREANGVTGWPLPRDQFDALVAYVAQFVPLDGPPSIVGLVGDGDSETAASEVERRADPDPSPTLPGEAIVTGESLQQTAGRYIDALPDEYRDAWRAYVRKSGISANWQRWSDAQATAVIDWVMLEEEPETLGAADAREYAEPLL